MYPLAGVCDGCIPPPFCHAAQSTVECLQDPDLTRSAAVLLGGGSHGMPWLKGPGLIAGYRALIGAASLPTMGLNSRDGT